MIDTVNLGKRYSSRRWGLKGCSLTVPEGGVTALVGPNGAGKTTLLLLAAGLITPTTGTVTVMGRSPRDARSLLPELGFVAQNHPLYRGFRVSEMLHLGSVLNGRWDSATFEKRMSTHRIPLDQKVGTLSGGQRAQVALAMALAKRPKLLLLDEPVAALDPLARREFLDTLSESVRRFELTVVISSHLIEDVRRVCNRLILLSSSHLQLNGEIPLLLAAHRLVAVPDAVNAKSGGHVIVGPPTREANDGMVVRMRSTSGAGPVNGRSISLEELILAYMNAPATTVENAVGTAPESHPN